MKKIITIAALFAIVFSGCEKPYEDKEIGDPIYSAENMNRILNGKWVLRKAMHIDETSLTKETIDITDFFTQETGSRMPNISFNVGAKTYTSDTADVALHYFGTGGTWKYDNEAYPSKIILNNGATINIASNIQITNGYLAFKQSLSCGTEATQTYNLEFIKK